MRPKGKAETLEMRRRIAVEMLKKEMGIREVARIVHASPSSVVGWKRQYEKEGDEGLKSRPIPGVKPRLTEVQKKALLETLTKGAKSSGYANELWTLERVAEVIKKEFGVTYHISHVWRLLHQLGWSAQKPERRARERDEAKVKQWKDEDWPRIKKS